MRKLPVLLFVLLLALSACSEGFGNKMEAGNLVIYYDVQKDRELAKSIAEFWRDNDLMGSEPQNIRLQNLQEAYYLSLIRKEKITAAELSFDERKLLIDLQSDLNTYVFTEGKNVEILISDRQFKPLVNINE